MEVGAGVREEGGRVTVKSNNCQSAFKSHARLLRPQRILRARLREVPCQTGRDHRTVNGQIMRQYKTCAHFQGRPIIFRNHSQSYSMNKRGKKLNHS